MNNTLIIYIIWSILIGLCYFYNWYRYEKPKELKQALRSRRLLIYLLVFVMSTVGAPLSAIELLYKNYKNKKEIQK